MRTKRERNNTRKEREEINERKNILPQTHTFLDCFREKSKPLKCKCGNSQNDEMMVEKRRREVDRNEMFFNDSWNFWSFYHLPRCTK